MLLCWQDLFEFTSDHDVFSTDNQTALLTHHLGTNGVQIYEIQDRAIAHTESADVLEPFSALIPWASGPCSLDEKGKASRLQDGRLVAAYGRITRRVRPRRRSPPGSRQFLMAGCSQSA